MPRDASPSSEGEPENPTTGAQPNKLGKTTRYQCPVDFVSSSYKTCRSTFRKKLKKSSKELWLIKAPASFDPECFQGIQVPLAGLQTLKVLATEGGANSEGDQRIYNVRASAHGTSELYLLTRGKNSSEGVGFGPTFSGLLTVCESYGDKSSNQSLQVIPAAPAPSIPPGLKHRFPLLTQTPAMQTFVAKNETDGLPKRFIEEIKEEHEEGRKKKRKKEKRIKLEPEEETDVADIRDEVLEEKKRRKKKKDNEEEQELMVKCEPADSWNDEVVEDAKKKKKKKKKTKTDDD